MSNTKLSEIFKTEYGNLIAVLCHYYSLEDIQLAEDIVSETFLKAMKSWSHNGIPTNPKAWLRKVAINKLRDDYRRIKTFTEKIRPNLEYIDEVQEEITIEIIKDSQLKMIFLVCNPKLSNESQFCLALRILCGFNIEEIAKALLSTKETINKRLYRAKKQIREEKLLNLNLSIKDYTNRLDNVLRVIYLLFNEGYYSNSNLNNIREEICWEAMRLTIFLTQQENIEKPKIQALLALMCFHASRLEARIEGELNTHLYYEQDHSKWDQRLIKQGLKHLKQSRNTEIISKYHIEASIAYWHTINNNEKWNNILSLYDSLLQIDASPIIALNRAYALAMSGSVIEAIKQTQELKLLSNHNYHCLLAELYKLNHNKEMEIKHLQTALTITTKQYEINVIENKLHGIN